MVSEEETPTTVLFSTWTMNGSPLTDSAIKTVERAVERAVEYIEKQEGIRLLYTTVRA